MPDNVTPKWYDVPYPEHLLRPFKFLWRLIFKDKTIPVPSDRVVRFILIATAVLKLILMIAEKLGILRLISNFFIKICFTPKYMPFTWVLLIAIWPVAPVIISIMFGKKSKKSQVNNPQIGGTL